MRDVGLTAAVPVLPVDDADKAGDFYVTRLGFAKAFAFGPYAGVQRGSVMIHLDAAESARYPGPTCCRVDVRGVDVLCAEMEAQGVVHPEEPLETSPSACASSASSTAGGIGSPSPSLPEALAGAAFGTSRISPSIRTDVLRLS